MTFEKIVGQKLMFGISGTRVTPDTIRLFAETHAGGLILFRRNFESALQVKSFVSELENALGRRLLVAVDHEGGRVVHLTDGVTFFPSNMALGMTGRIDHAARQGEIEAYELKAMNIDINLAPCLDVLTGTFSPNIGIRSYGRDPGLVAKLGTARIRTMQAAGISACAKHFPGQGHSPVDAHLKLPVLNTSAEEMRRLHFVPFKAAVDAGVNLVMTSHPVYSGLDPEACPATFSKKIVRDYLRRELGFEKVVISDDLEMGALSEISPVGEAAGRAAGAGHDLLLVCKDPEKQRDAARKILARYRRPETFKELEASIARIENLKKVCVRDTGQTGLPSAHPDGESLAREIARDCAETAGDRKKIKDFLNQDPSPVFIFPGLSALENLYGLEPCLLDEKKFLADELKRLGLQPASVTVVGLEPADEEIETACKTAAKADAAVFFCYDASLSSQNRKLLQKIQDAARRLLVVLLRDPWDEGLVREGIPCLQAYGFRAVQIRAILEFIFKRPCG